MPSNWGNDPDTVLRSLFGAMKNARSGGGSAQNMWGALRDAASSYARGTLNITQGPGVTEEQVAAKAQELLSHVTVQKVSEYTKYASEWWKAGQNLGDKGFDQQIEGKDIWTPPWAKTVGNPAIPPRYRARVLMSVYNIDSPNDMQYKWSTYDLTGPLTTMGDVLSQAQSSFAAQRYNAGTIINRLEYYELETV